MCDPTTRDEGVSDSAVSDIMDGIAMIGTAHMELNMRRRDAIRVDLKSL